MVKNLTFKTVQDKINVINILQGEDLITLSKLEKYKIKMKAQNFTVKDGELFFLKGESKLKVFSDNEVNAKKECIKNIHIDGHCGVIKRFIDERFFNIKQNEIAKIVSECQICQQGFGLTTVTPIRPIITLKVRERYMADCISLLEYQDVNNKYILNIIDCYSKYMWVAKLKEKSAIKMRSKFQKIFDRYGPPKILHTDNG
ncbi:hypothetical protein A3Q56_04503 [Intoshia linei]|uniref:Integrase catalytic domain-containing protein n=1 Tax=Intoshia linei TaxID=1819745 RepID=A0A177B0H4_9BILA|nr:hypothetical protein A3Q56_04503 [Intoshia linei]